MLAGPQVAGGLFGTFRLEFVDAAPDGRIITGATNCTGCVQPSNEVTLNGGNNKARYIITRLCSAAGAPSAVDCAVPVGSALTGGGNKGVTNYKDTKIETMVVSSQYYRIVVRAQSARGTVSFTETIVRL